MPGRAAIALLACLSAVAVAGCGSSEPGTIPPENSAEMITLLDEMQENAANGQCEIAVGQAEEFKDAVDRLPAEVDDEVKQGLFEAADRLIALAQDPSQCADTGASGADGFESTPTTSSSSTTESSTSTTTTTTEDDDEETGQQPSGEESQGDGGQADGDQGSAPVEPPGDAEPAPDTGGVTPSERRDR